AADHNDPNARLGNVGCWWESELAQAKRAAVIVSQEAEQPQLARFAGLGVLALNQAAQPGHAEQVTALSVRSCVALELQCRITVSEYNRQQITLVQRATAAIGEFKTSVP